MRYREKMNTYTEGTWTGNFIPSWGTPTYRSVDYIATQQYIAMLDIVTPNWRARIAKGEIISNPMASRAFSSSVSPSVMISNGFVKTNPKNTWTRRHSGVIPPAFNAVVLDWIAFDAELEKYKDYRDVALSKAWANVDISEIQALASLGELPETLSWMTSLLKRAISLIRLFNQKKLLLAAGKMVASKKSMLDSMSDLWLEYRYAIRPLVFDMHSAVMAWNAVVEKSNRFTARGFDEIPLTTSASTYQYTLPVYGKPIVSRVSTTSANFRAGVLFVIDGNINEFRSIWGFDQPIETVWELIPFSFIVDWFFNVGHVISSWTYNPGLKPLTSWCTETISTSITDNWTIPQYVDKQYTVVNEDFYPGCTKTTLLSKRRIIAPSRALLPKFNLKLNTAKLIDLATIGRSLFANMRRS